MSVQAATTDQGGDVRKAVVDKLGLSWNPCIGHRVNRACQRSLGVVKHVDPSTKKKVSINHKTYKAVATCLKINKKFLFGIAKRMLAEKAKAKDLAFTQVTKTGGIRWNTFPAMMARQNVLADSMLSVHAENREIFKGKNADSRPSEKWKQETGEMAAILNPIDELYTLIQTRQGASSYHGTTYMRCALIRDGLAEDAGVTVPTLEGHFVEKPEYALTDAAEQLRSSLRREWDERVTGVLSTAQLRALATDPRGSLKELDMVSEERREEIYDLIAADMTRHAAYVGGAEGRVASAPVPDATASTAASLPQVGRAQAAAAKFLKRTAEEATAPRKSAMRAELDRFLASEDGLDGYDTEQIQDGKISILDIDPVAWWVKYGQVNYPKIFPVALSDQGGAPGSNTAESDFNFTGLLLGPKSGHSDPRFVEVKMMVKRNVKWRPSEENPDPKCKITDATKSGRQEVKYMSALGIPILPRDEAKADVMPGWDPDGELAEA